jgi:hypothetical protein
MVIRVILVSAWCLTLAGCSGYMPSISSVPGLGFLKSAPTTEQVRVDSVPIGAEAKSSNGSTCATPCDVILASGTDAVVTVSKPGYLPLTVSVHPDGPGGQLLPNPVVADLQPLTPPSPAKKSAPPKRKAKAATGNQ